MVKTISQFMLLTIAPAVTLAAPALDANAAERIQSVIRRGGMGMSGMGMSGMGMGGTSCSPGDVVLADSPQWQHEEGYWIGDLSLYSSDGTPSESSSWPYGYANYRGFITGNVEGNAYRQRNVFMYPPLNSGNCQQGSVLGNGVCGVNGNSKIFAADQQATTCSDNPELQGDIEGPYEGLFYTTTELVGRNNSLLYQVWLTAAALNYYDAVVLQGLAAGRCTEIAPFTYDCGYTEDRLSQSQLTTLTNVNGQWYRTRTAQGFEMFNPTAIGVPTYASYYRERQVDEATFWTEFDQTTSDYNILASDLCGWKTGATGGSVPSGVSGRAACEAHLDESFAL